MISLGNIPSAIASLIGDTVTVCANFTDDGCPNTNIFSSALEETGTVGDGTEFDNLTFAIDIQDSMFVLSLTNGSIDQFLFNPTTWIISDLDWVDKPGKIIGVEKTTGIPDGTITAFTDNSVTINLPEVIIEGNIKQNYKFNLQTKHIPEPTSALSLLGLGTLGAASTLKPKLKSSKRK
ncbi:hypothetical protein [Okeania sp. SIO2C9]|uniref:hypothetical protein n=1 Tax=Okeania sp. SIO2C9 TaxID=2607791 RepID=UPI0025FD4BE1|nr:hypothetical protein [Okeania sp. SIO2C9]